MTQQLQRNILVFTGSKSDYLLHSSSQKMILAHRQNHRQADPHLLRPKPTRRVVTGGIILLHKYLKTNSQLLSQTLRTPRMLIKNTDYLPPLQTLVEQASSWQWNQGSPLQTLYQTGSSECPRYTGQSRGLQVAPIYYNHKNYKNCSCKHRLLKVYRWPASVFSTVHFIIYVLSLSHSHSSYNTTKLSYLNYKARNLAIANRSCSASHRWLSVQRYYVHFLTKLRF